MGLVRHFLVCVVLTVALPTVALADPGDLDPSFSRDGVVAGPERMLGQDVEVQPDGAVVTAGSATVARYKPNGQLDTSFSGDGLRTIRIDRGFGINEIKLLDDGRIVVAGYAAVGPYSSAIAVVRLQQDGSFDKSFGGGDGYSQLEGTYFRAYDLKLGPDDQIVLVGGQLVARFLANGSLDPSFSQDGLIDVAEDAFVRTVAVRPDGSIIVGGELGRTVFARLYLTQYTPDGIEDPQFSFEPGSDTFRSILNSPASTELTGDGVLYVSFYGSRGPFRYGEDSGIGTFRVAPDGSIDQDFGPSGAGSYRNPGPVLELDDHDRPLLGGVGFPGRGFEATFGIVRLTSEGFRDKAFGRDGIALPSVGGEYASVNDIAIGSEGVMVATGERDLFDGGYATVRLTTTSGHSDMDADGLVDGRDRCALNLGDRHAGCPGARPTITARQPGDRYLKGRVNAEVGGCKKFVQIRMKRIVPGKDYIESTVRTTRRGYWRVSRVQPGARYRAVVLAHFARTRAYCRRAETLVTIR